LIVATCQIIVDVIQHGFLSIEDLNVLVFDECHHGRGDHPMHQLMQLFENIPKSKQPRVVGLSGMLVSGGVMPENVEEELAKIENIFMATIATAQNLQDYQEIQQFSTNPNEKIVTFLPSPSPSILQKVEKIIEECKRCITNYKLPKDTVISSKTLAPTTPPDVKKLVKRLNDFVYQSNDMGKWFTFRCFVLNSHYSVFFFKECTVLPYLFYQF
jgi:endoribonuclease Dicer